jgi:hypothetical protein
MALVRKRRIFLIIFKDNPRSLLEASGEFVELIGAEQSDVRFSFVDVDNHVKYLFAL